MNREEKLLGKLWTAYCQVMGVDPNDRDKYHCFLSGMACVCSFVEEGSKKVKEGLDKESMAMSFMSLSQLVRARMNELNPK